MSKQFCPSCGAEITGGGSFCPACGKAIAQEQPPIQEPAAAQEQNPAQEQPRPQQPYAAPYPAGGAPQYSAVPVQKKPLNKNLIIGICAGAAAVILAVVLIIVFAGGSPAGDILKNYRYKDIVGDYEGVLTVENIKVGGDYDELAQYAGFHDKETIEKFEGEEMDCEISLDDDELSIWAEEGIFFSSGYSYIEDIEFVKGRAKGKMVDEEEDAGTMTVTYDLTLHEGTSKNTDYRIYGTIKMEYKLQVLKAKCSYMCEITVDCEY